MLIDKPQCNFKNCRFYFDGNCRSADIYENCKLTYLHSEIAKLTVDLDNAKAEAARELISDVIEILNDEYRKCDTKEIKTILVIVNAITELKKKYIPQNDDRCVVCGEIVPEGRQVCPKCQIEKGD